MKRSSRCAVRIALCVALLTQAGALCEKAAAQAGSTASGASQPASLVVGEKDKKLGVTKTAPPSATTTSHAAEPAKADDSAWMVRTGGSLVGVLVLIVGVGFLVRKMAQKQGGLMASLGPGGRAPSGVLEVIGRFPVARGTTLVLLKVDRRVLLLCQTAGKRLGGGAVMSTLCEITDADDVASILVKARDEEGESLAKKFESMLGSFGGKGSTTVEPKPTGISGAAAGLAQMLRGGKTTATPAAAAKSVKPLTKAQAIAALESRLQTLRTASAKEKAA